MKPRIVVREHLPEKTLMGFLFGPDPRGDPQAEFPFSIVLYAGPVILESSTRFQTMDAAEKGAREMVDALQAFFKELESK